jgi:hypothetical protein
VTTIDSLAHLPHDTLAGGASQRSSQPTDSSGAKEISRAYDRVRASGVRHRFVIDDTILA